MKLTRLPLIPNVQTPVINSDGTMNVQWYDFFRRWNGAFTSSAEAEARDFQLKAALLDPLTYTFGDTDSAALTVPTGKVWLATNIWRVRPAGLTDEMFQRKADSRDPFLMPAGTSFDMTPHHATMQYCDPYVVIDPASPDYDKRYVDDPKGLYFERMGKLESLPLRRTSGNIPIGSVLGETDVNLNWGALTEGWGIIRHISVENLSWMLALNAGATAGVNLVPEISDNHATRLHGFPAMMPFRKTDFTKIRLRGGDYLGNPVGALTTTYNGWGIISWSALDETTW